MTPSHHSTEDAFSLGVLPSGNTSMGLCFQTQVWVVLTVKNLPVNAGDPRDTGSIPELGRSPGGGNGNPLQYSCLENPMDGGGWQATVHEVTKSRTRLND